MKYSIKELISDKISGEWGDESINGGGYKVLRTTNFTNLGKINFENVVERKIDEKKVNQKHLKSGDVIIEKSGGSPTQPVGRVVFFDLNTTEKYLCNNFTAILRPNSDLVNSKYFFYQLHLLHTRGRTLKYQNKTTGIINLKLDNYLDEEIEVPPIPDQLHIATLLTKAENLISQRKESIRLLDEYLKSTFIEKFIDKNYPLEKLENLCIKITDGEHLKPNYIENGFPFISVVNISRGFLSFENCKYISGNDFIKFTRRCKPELDDIIYTKVGATYGRAVLVDTERPFSLYVSVALIKPFKEKVNSKFLQFVINHPFVKRQADKSIKGAGVPDLHLIEIKSFKIPMPPRELQDEFADVVKKIEALKDKYKSSLQLLENLYGSLSQRAFRGELSFKEEGLMTAAEPKAPYSVRLLENLSK